MHLESVVAPTEELNIEVGRRQGGGEEDGGPSPFQDVLEEVGGVHALNLPEDVVLVVDPDEVEEAVLPCFVDLGEGGIDEG